MWDTSDRMTSSFRVSQLPDLVFQETADLCQIVGGNWFLLNMLTLSQWFRVTVFPKKVMV